MLSGHISFFLESLPMGGAERVMLTLAGEARRQGHKVDLVLVRRKGALLTEIPEGVGVFEIGRSPRLLAIPALLRSGAVESLGIRNVLLEEPPSALRSLPRLARYLRERRPDAMLATLPANNLAALWARRLAGVSTRIVIREASTMSLGHAAASDAFDRRLPQVAQRWYPEADGIVAVSSGAAEDMASFAGIDSDRIARIYNPVRLEQIERLAEMPLDDPWLDSDGSPLILGLGRLDPAKDYPTLLRAFAKVVAERPCRLLVLGEGKLRPKLLQIRDSLGLQSKVRFPGMDANPFRYLKRADLFVLSSALEGFPNVLLEAMACGVPVVSTDCRSGPREILDGGRYGALVPVGDADALSREMLKALTHSPCSKEDLRRRVLEFSESRITADYLDLLLPEASLGGLAKAVPDRKASAG